MASPFATLTPAQIEPWVQAALPLAAQGQVNPRIGYLAAADPAGFALHIERVAAPSLQAGTAAQRFPLMSVVKPLLLLYLLETAGAAAVDRWVGCRPSDLPFNALAQLEADQGFPRNPMINSGAITLAAQVDGSDALGACQRVCHWLNQRAGSQLALDRAVLASVAAGGREPNLALATALARSGHIANPARALAVYEHLCCLAGTVADLARLGCMLGRPGAVATPHRCRVNAVMLGCGLYEASADYARRVGLPMKSGIGGGLLAVVPGQGAIASYSPALDATGNPVVGVALVETLATRLGLSLFDGS